MRLASASCLTIGLVGWVAGWLGNCVIWLAWLTGLAGWPGWPGRPCWLAGGLGWPSLAGLAAGSLLIKLLTILTYHTYLPVGQQEVTFVICLAAGGKPASPLCYLLYFIV